MKMDRTELALVLVECRRRIREASLVLLPEVRAADAVVLGLLDDAVLKIDEAGLRLLDEMQAPEVHPRHE